MDELEEIVFKHALLNAAKHKGSANPGAVMGSIMSSEPELRPRAKEIGPLSGKIVAQVNALSPEEQKAKIEQTAQAILDARALYPDSSLADLYDELTMPPELRKAHDRNNVAVMKAYGFPTSMSEAECVAALMKMYQELTK